MTLPPYPGNDDTPEEEHGEGQHPQSPEGEQAAYPPPPPAPYGQQPSGQSPYGQQTQGQNPYGQNPYGQNPYGQQPSGQSPYGQGQWGAPGYGTYQGPNDATGQSYSGFAIAALVLSLTCVLSFVGVILGIVGLFKTGRNKGKGRWMAITAIVVGTLFTLILGGIVAGGVWLGTQFVTPGNAEAGQCVNVDQEGRDVSLFKTSCSGDHDAEIFEVHELTEQEITAFDEGRLGQGEICVLAAAEQFGVSPGRSITIDGEDVRVDAVLNDPDDPQAGDNVVCYVEARRGVLDRSLTE